jgi:hypothetical protein
MTAMPDLRLLFLEGLLLVLQVVWLLLPMLTALLFVGPLIGVILWQTRARES